MIKRQRKAILLIALAWLVVLTCTAQRMAALRALSMVPAVVWQQDSEDDAPAAPCELSAKSLLAAGPALCEGALFAAALLLLVLAVRPAHRRRRRPLLIISPPRLRVHLRLCVFRE